ncbi:MAG: 4-deoxy-4-formamido-L-arabinose-phosphoundecaprenol deformylase [Candidatus Schekmanbacteria bacterium]|nr:4-deoxy-4-formamido-L-arabinose-phosphoundecaprenol deformylase [Candidatus Schekmanbacteria bacterium]
MGLRVDVDTLRGTRDGVPRLLEILDRHRVRATFFFSVGPDNMGRHLWRLLRPSFLIKMLRTHATSLYGWDIVLRGTLWPGPQIGARAAAPIRATAAAGHEIGFHAWDHEAWQRRVERLAPAEIRAIFARGIDSLAAIIGRMPTAAAAPGWRCTNTVLLEKEAFPFAYGSDCRGSAVFVPVAGGQRLSQPQIPVTLPTYDELVGRQGVTDDSYNQRLLAMVRPGELNVLTVHAEVEGGAKSDLFDRFLQEAAARDVCLRPLGELLPRGAAAPLGAIGPELIAGRDGWVAVQRQIAVAAE